MSRCIDRLPHSCGTRKGLQVFAREDGKVDGFCFNCRSYVENPYGEPRVAADVKDKEVSIEEVKEEMAELLECQAIDLPDRKLRADDLHHYSIGVGYDRTDGVTPAMLLFPYRKDGQVVRVKVKLIKGKRFWNVGFDNEVDLFGWEEAVATGAKRLIITEGELDAAALRKILLRFQKEEYAHLTPAVVSLPNGAASASRDIGRLQHKIRKHFKEIAFCFDADEAGKRATEECCKLFPDATAISLPAKDANDCILKGVQRAAFNACTFNAAKPKNSKLVFGESIHAEARKPAQYGELSWPWEHINKATRGIRYGETIYIGAGVC